MSPETHFQQCDAMSFVKSVTGVFSLWHYDVDIGRWRKAMSFLTPIALVCMLFATSMSAQVTSIVPYLYYYSNALGGFVIERADGSDSRLFEGETLSYPSATEPGWSPSGNWLAWHNVDGYAERVDSSKRLNVLDNYSESMSRVFDMKWSSDEQDILWIAGRNEDCLLCEDDVTFILRDMNAERDLAQFTIPVYINYPFSNIAPLVWSLAADQVNFYVLSGEAPAFQPIYITMHFDGTVIQEAVTMQVWEACCPPPAAPLNDYQIGDAADSSTGRYRATEGYDTQLLDTETQTTAILPSHSASTLNYRLLNFDPSETWILMAQTDFAAGGGSGFYLNGITTVTGTYWRELSPCNACADWLPKRVDIELLSPGSPQSVLLVPAETVYQDEQAQGWMRGNYTMTCNRGVPSDRVLQPVDEGNTYILHNDRPCSIPETAPLEVLVAVSLNSSFLALSTSINEIVSLWDIATGNRITRLNTFGYEMWFSDDSQELYTRTTRAIHTWDIGEILRRYSGES